MADLQFSLENGRQGEMEWNETHTQSTRGSKANLAC